MRRLAEIVWEKTTGIVIADGSLGPFDITFGLSFEFRRFRRLVNTTHNLLLPT